VVGLEGLIRSTLHAEKGDKVAKLGLVIEIPYEELSDELVAKLQKVLAGSKKGHTKPKAGIEAQTVSEECEDGHPDAESSGMLETEEPIVEECLEAETEKIDLQSLRNKAAKAIESTNTATVLKTIAKYSGGKQRLADIPVAQYASVAAALDALLVPADDAAIDTDIPCAKPASRTELNALVAKIAKKKGGKELIVKVLAENGITGKSVPDEKIAAVLRDLAATNG